MSALAGSAVFILIPFAAGAVTAPRTALKTIYDQRKDLQKSFDAHSWRAKKGSRGVATGTLQNWARANGWKEYPGELGAYKPEPFFIDTNETRVKKIKEPSVTAESFIIIDPLTSVVLASHKPDMVWPMASLTKLVTASVAANASIAPSQPFAIAAIDEVGGGRLHVKPNTVFSFNDLMGAMLVGSANNAARAVARAVSGTHEEFVAAMNSWISDHGLKDTVAVDPSGIEVGNVSTAREVSQIAQAAFALDAVRAIAEKSFWDITTETGKHHIKTTDDLVTNRRYRDIHVVAGKTGYIDEAEWNLVAEVEPARTPHTRTLLIVALGSGSKRASFDDVATLARWTWKNFK